MHTKCPNCHAVYEIKKPTRETRLTCKKCKTIFLTPVEALCFDEQEDFGFVKKQLKHSFQEARRQLKQTYHESAAQLDRKHKQAQQKRAHSAEPTEEYAVKKPLARKLIKSVLMIYFFVILCVNAIFMVYQYQDARQNIFNELKNSQVMFQRGLGKAIWTFDKSSLDAIITGMLEHPVIIGFKIDDEFGNLIEARGMFLNDAGDKIIAQEAVVNAPDEKRVPPKLRTPPVSALFFYAFAITYPDEVSGEIKNVGKATIYSGRRLILERLKGSYALVLMNSVLVAVALFVNLAWVSRKILAQPLSLLTNAVTSLNLKNLDSLEITLPTSDQNELKILERSFNRMVKNLIDEQQANIHMTRTFEKFIPKQLLSRIAIHGIHSIRLGGIANENMTVLYCSIDNAAEISTNLDAAAIFEWLNDYLAKMNDAIEKHGGFMYKYANDDIMAFFDLNDHPLEALSAIYAAIDMHKALRTFNEQQAQHDFPSVSVSIGIACGDIWLGAIGSQNRIEATGIGDAIDAAVKLQHLTYRYQSQILVTANILKLVKTFQACLFREVDRTHLSETGGPVRIFEVFDAEPVRKIKKQLLPSFEEGLRLFQAKRWEEAAVSFEACLQIHPTDAVSQLYLKRCQEYESDNKITVFLRNECSLAPLLREAENIEQLAGNFELVTFQDNDPIMNSGDPGLNFYLLLDGSAKVFVKKEDSSDLQVATLKKGESFGEISLLTGDPVSATIISVGTSQVLVLNRRQFDGMVRQYPQLNHYFHTRYSKYMADLQTAVLRHRRSHN
ncbi:cyclic nucleotide-binding domain-containing protein [Desulfococcaceae bacterium HSG7]|nr:cyclic nucleotide-binding domain-containing protein [Desulfococcaceae bacterium HSG7]